MTNQEKWDEFVNKIEELGDELQELLDSIPVETNDDDIKFKRNDRKSITKY